MRTILQFSTNGVNLSFLVLVFIMTSLAKCPYTLHYSCLLCCLTQNDDGYCEEKHYCLFWPEGWLGNSMRGILCRLTLYNLKYSHFLIQEMCALSYDHSRTYFPASIFAASLVIGLTRNPFWKSCGAKGLWEAKWFLYACEIGFVSSCTGQTCHHISSQFAQILAKIPKSTIWNQRWLFTLMSCKSLRNLNSRHYTQL